MNLENKIASKLLETIPVIVRSIRSEIKDSLQGKLTFPQFRILSNIDRGLTHVGKIAEHHGVTQPSMTKMVNTLVNKGLIVKKQSSEDGRITDLALSSNGKKTLSSGKELSKRGLAQSLMDLSEQDKKRILEALEVLEKFYVIRIGDK